MRADELERRLGVAVEPVVEGWVVDPATLQAARTALSERLDRARPVGLDVARLGEHDRAVLVQLEREQLVGIVAGYAVGPGWEDELARHPLVRQLEEQLFTPPAPTTAQVPPEVLRALVRRGHVLVKDGDLLRGAGPERSGDDPGRADRRAPRGVHRQRGPRGSGHHQEVGRPLAAASGRVGDHGPARRSAPRARPPSGTTNP